MTTGTDSCTWAGQEFDEQYITSCGHVFEFLDGDVDENDFVYCPFCGKGIIAVEWEYEEEEE